MILELVNEKLKENDREVNSIYNEIQGHLFSIKLLFAYYNTFLLYSKFVTNFGMIV